MSKDDILMAEVRGARRGANADTTPTMQARRTNVELEGRGLGWLRVGMEGQAGWKARNEAAELSDLR